MGLFDGVTKTTACSYAKPKVSSTQNNGGQEPHKINSIVNEDVRIKRAAQLKKHNNTMDTLATKRKLSTEATIFGGMKHEGAGVKTTIPHAFSGKPQMAAEINKAKNVFMENLTTALFINKINVINCEALTVESSLKENDQFKALNYERCLRMFEDIRAYKDFDKVVAENKVPGFICELWTLAREAAGVEADRRFDFNTTYATTGYSEEKVHDYIQNELNSLFITNESLNEYFESTTAMIIAENSDVIDEIKSKVTGELDNYKKTAQRIADIKKAVRDKIDSADSVDGANGKSDGSEEDKSPDGNNSDETQTADGGDDSSKSTDGDKSSSNNPDNGDSKNSDTDSKEQKTTESEESSSSETEETSDNNSNDQPDTSAADNTDPNKKNGDNGGESEENADLPENQEELQKISPKVTQEIEDAATFATTWSHTFNTGDEKFENLRKRFSQEFTAALNDNDIDKVNEIRANVIATKNRLEQINNDSDNKYAETVKKFAELDANIKFEFGKYAGKTAKDTEANKTVFESLVISIAKRKKASKGIALEDTTHEFDYVEAQSIVTEALINQTTLETFNTLKLIDSGNPDDVSSMKSFIKQIKQ